MRWPSFFGRAASAKAAPKPEVRAPLREWASLPAIQRVVGEPQLTAATGTFLDSLAGTREPDLSLEPLGHNVSLDAPSGLVSGIARSVETYAPASDFVNRPKPRREASVQRRAVDSADDAAASGEMAGIETADEPAMLPATVVDEPLAAQAPLTHMAAADAMAVMRLAMPRPAAAATPIQTIQEATGFEHAPDPLPRPLPAQRLTLGQSRRLGLGAPLQRSQVAAVQRAIETPALDLAPPAHVANVQQTDTAQEPAAQPVETKAGDPVSAPVERIAPLAGAPVQRAAAMPESDEPQPSAEMPLAGQTRVTGFPRAEATEHAVIQRAVATPLPPLFSRPASAPSAPIASERPSLLTLTRASGSGEASAGAAAPYIALQRLPAVAGGELNAPVAQAELREVVVPAGRRLSSAAFPHQPVSLPPPAPQAPSVQRVAAIAQDFVAFSPFVATGDAVSPHQAAASTAMPAVQREVAAGEGPMAAPSAASAPVAVAPGAGVEAGAAPGQSDKDLDELGRKLYDRISLQLRRDLLVQRERAGMVSDLR